MLEEVRQISLDEKELLYSDSLQYITIVWGKKEELSTLTSISLYQVEDLPWILK